MKSLFKICKKKRVFKLNYGRIFDSFKSKKFWENVLFRVLDSLFLKLFP